MSAQILLVNGRELSQLKQGRVEHQWNRIGNLLKSFVRKVFWITSQGILPLTNVNATQSDASVQIAIPMPLNFRIATGAAACWACNTAADVVDSILKVTPDGPHKPNLLELCKAFKRLN